MTFKELTSQEKNDRPEYTLADLRRPTYHNHEAYLGYGRSIAKDALHHSLLAHIIFQAVFLARVAFARATIEVAFFDLIICSGVIWPKPKDPCFSFRAVYLYMYKN